MTCWDLGGARSEPIITREGPIGPKLCIVTNTAHRVCAEDSANIKLCR